MGGADLLGRLQALRADVLAPERRSHATAAHHVHALREPLTSGQLILNLRAEADPDGFESFYRANVDRVYRALAVTLRRGRFSASSARGSTAWNSRGSELRSAWSTPTRRR